MALDAARRIVGQEGLQALTTRSLAKAIGYTGGTLYQLFDNYDDLVDQMNAETIDEFRALCEQIDLGRGPSTNLRALADTYIKFTTERLKLWNAIFEHRLPEGQRNEEYMTSVRRMLSLVERAIAPLFGPDEQEAKLRDVRVLWSALYGISALYGHVGELIDTVIDIYVRSKGQGRSTP